MTVFVSYARRDNGTGQLQALSRVLTDAGVDHYIDDLHHERYGTDRRDSVTAALRGAETFLAVDSPHYLRTPWTRAEFWLAVARGIPVYVLTTDR